MIKVNKGQVEINGTSLEINMELVMILITLIDLRAQDFEETKEEAFNKVIESAAKATKSVLYEER